MSLKWYVLHVKTGKEADIKAELERLGITASAPLQAVHERKGGRWRHQHKIVLPGYVFARLQLTDADYYTARAIPGVIRFLGSSHPEPLREDEESFVSWLDNSGDPLSMSDVTMAEGQPVKVLSGPLKGHEGMIVRLNRRQRRAIVAITLASRRCEISLPINILS